MTAYQEVIVVESEEWLVQADPETPGQYRLRWVSGSGAGFTTRFSNPSFEPSRTMFEDQIRDYMSNADWESGELL